MRPRSAAMAGAALLAATSSAAAQKASATAGNRKAPAPPELLEALKRPGATRKEKSDALRDLAQVGGRGIVAVVSKLLQDPELADMARYAIEPIPDPAVDRALRATARKASGLPLVGAVASLGVRRDVGAVPILVQRLGDADPAVAAASAKALGSIGTMSAARALVDALTKSTGAPHAAAAEGLFRAAETLTARGQKKAAVGLYEALAKSAACEGAKGVAVRRAEALRDA